MPFRAPGLFSTLCTAFYALFGMLLRGGKTVEKRKFLQDSKFRLFIYSYFVRFRMFVTFTYLFFFLDVDLRSMCVDISLDSVRIGRYAIFVNVLKNRCMDAICY